MADQTKTVLPPTVDAPEGNTHVHQSEAKMANAEGAIDSMDVDMVALTIEEEQELTCRDALTTFKELSKEAEEADKNLRLAVKSKATSEAKAELMEKMLRAQDLADKYRARCKKNYPTRLEFLTTEEINARNAAIAAADASAQDRSRFVPKDLPALQIVGGENWAQNKATHVTTERFIKKFESEVEGANFVVEDQWARFLPKCLNDV